MKTLIIMPTYGRIPFLNRALASFLKQNYDDKTLVIINDDNNIELKCNYKNVVCINLTKKISVGAKRNIGCNIGNYSLLIPCDDDDIMLPNRITNCVKQHANNKNIGLFSNNKCYTIYGNKFTITHPTPNMISYTKQTWLSVGGYPDISTGEDREFKKNIQNHFITNDVSLIDLIYNFGGINYHLSCSNIGDIEKIAHKQLLNLDLLGKQYHIEPDYDEYEKFIKLDAIYKEKQTEISIKHIKLGSIEILN